VNDLDFPLDREVLIVARRSTVFRYFVDSKRFAAWWGEGSRVEPRPGGALLIRYPNGVTASGQVVEIVEDEKFVFTYGYDSGSPIPAGSSRVTITLEDRDQGTLVKLRHELPDEKTRDAHVQGWRYQLAVFSRVVTEEQHASIQEVVDLFFRAWGELDRAKRRELLEKCVTDDFTFEDPYSSTRGIDDLNEHLAAVQMHMAGVTLRRASEPRHCKGTALVSWLAVKPDGSPPSRGTNVLTLAPDGRLAAAVGLWEKP